MRVIVRIFLGGLLAVFLSSAALAATSKSGAQPLDKIVAVVNSDVITQSQLDQQIDAMKQQLQSANIPLPADAKMRQEVLDQMINQKLQLLVAKRTNTKISDAQLDQAINGIAMRNHLTMAQLKVAIGKQGIDYNTFRNQIRTQMTVQEVQMRAIGANVAVSEQEINAFIKAHSGGDNAYHIFDILVPLADNPTPAQVTAAQKQADSLLQQLRQGGDFQKIVANQSGTDLGWRTTAQLPTIFATQVATMKTGEVSGPLRAPNGFHILKLVEMKTTGLAITHDQAKQVLFQQKIEKNAQPWLQQLRATAYIKIMD